MGGLRALHIAALPAILLYLALRDLQLWDSQGTLGLKSAEGRCAAFSRVFPPSMVSDQFLSVTDSLAWTLGASLFPILWLSDAPVWLFWLQRKDALSLPWNVGSYLVKCWHLLCCPWVTVLVDGVEGQATQCRTDQYHPEAHQVDVEGPVSTHRGTPCKSSISCKTAPGPNKQAPAPAPRGSSGWWLPAVKRVIIRLPAFHPLWGYIFNYMNYTSGFGTVWVPDSWQSQLWRWWEQYSNPHVSSCVRVLHCRRLAGRHSSSLASPFGKDKPQTVL